MWHSRALAAVAAVALTLAVSIPARAAGALNQWQPALWPTGTPMSLFDLIEQGYEVRAYQPGLDRSWLYLQKSRKLYRCNSPEAAGQPLDCEELVKPY